MATSGVFRQTAGPAATQYHGTAPRDKGIGGQPDPTAQIQRFYGRSENQPYLNPYHGRPVIDQTLGDQFGEPKYELNVGMQIKNLIMLDAEQPWFTIILPLQETDTLTITGTIWKFNRRLPRPTPYHAPSPYVTEEWEEFRRQLQRYGESIRMESDFFHTPEGMQNFMLKLTGIASDMIEGIRFDVMRELLRAVDEYKRYYSLKTFTEDPMKDIMARVALFASLNKAPTKYDELGVVTEKLERALHDVVSGPYELIVPPEWGIFFSRVNQTPAPQPYYFKGNLYIENGPTPKGIIGRNRYWEYPDVTVETGALPLRMLQRRISICEHYMSSFKGRDMDLRQKFTGLLAGTKDIGRMRNVIVYSADEDRPIELKIQEMIENGSIVPDSYSETANRSIDPYNHGKMAESLRTYYNNMGTEAEKYFYPQGIYDVEGDRGRIHRGISGTFRAAPIWLFWEPKDTWKSPRGNTEHVQIVKYSGETDENVQAPLDHLNQGQVLTAKLITKYSFDKIGVHYSNALRIHKALRDATCNDTYMRAWIALNLNNNIDVDLSGAGPNYTATYIGSQLTEANDPEYWNYWSGAIKVPNLPEFGPGSGGYYAIPAQAESGGLTVPPGCDSAIGILSIANVDETGGAGWGDIVNQVKTHYEVLLSMIDVARLLPDSELVNPRNRAPWVHSTDADIGALDVAYSNAVSQFHPPAFIRLHRIYIFPAQHPNTGEEIDVRLNFSTDYFTAESVNVGSAVTGSFPDEDDDEDNDEGDYETEITDADARIGRINPKSTTGISREGQEQPVFLRTALAFTPGMKSSMEKGELTIAFPADPKEDFALPKLPPPSLLSERRRGTTSVEEGEEEGGEEEGPSGAGYSIADLSRWSKTLSSGAPWRTGKAREFEHYALNMAHGLRYGLTRNGQFNNIHKGNNRGKSMREAEERRRMSTMGGRDEFSSWDSTPSRSIHSNLLGSKKRAPLGRRGGGGRRSHREQYDDGNYEEEGRGGYSFGETMYAGAREAHSWDAVSKPSLFMGKDRRRTAKTSKGYEVIQRFSGSNFVMKMKYITDSPGDPDVFFAIAAMMSRQDKKEHWMKLVKHHLHLAVDFLMFRIVEVMTESAILLKAGLGLTAVNHSDYKNGEVVSTKTYHGHLTVHYGAVVTKHDWLMMMEDMRLTGYLGGKGKGFMKHPKQLMRDQASTGQRERSVICFAMPIGCDYLPVLSISGHWQMPDVIPKNIPENGYLFNGVDWYERIWGFRTHIEKQRPMLELYRTKGLALPQVSFAGWHMTYDLTESKFMVANNGQGHLQGGDYQGAKAVMEGHKTWFDTPPLEEIRVY